jgi:hypothetical protein
LRRRNQSAKSVAKAQAARLGLNFKLRGLQETDQRRNDERLPGFVCWGWWDLVGLLFLIERLISSVLDSIHFSR